MMDRINIKEVVTQKPVTYTSGEVEGELIVPPKPDGPYGAVESPHCEYRVGGWKFTTFEFAVRAIAIVLGFNTEVLGVTRHSETCGERPRTTWSIWYRIGASTTNNER